MEHTGIVEGHEWSVQRRVVIILGGGLGCSALRLCPAWRSGLEGKAPRVETWDGPAREFRGFGVESPTVENPGGPPMDYKGPLVDDHQLRLVKVPGGGMLDRVY